MGREEGIGPVAGLPRVQATVGFLVGLGFLLLLGASSGRHLATAQGHKHEIKGYHVGQNVTFQCRRDGQWGPGPVCMETGSPMMFTYGVDTFASCGWHITDYKEYAFLVSLVRREQDWDCRMPMVPEVPPDHDWYVPFTIPVWGVVEHDHAHIENHLNFIIHATVGRIIGAAAYPVRNRLQFGRTGSIITMHGPVKWFAGHTYLPFSSGGRRPESQTQSSALAFMSCVLTFMLSVIGFTLFYQFYLRKRLIQKMLKVE